MDVQVGDDERGRRVAIKHAETPEEAARLRREADLLDVATHPALVELLAFDDGPLPVLQTAYVGSSLTAGRALEVDEIAGVVAATASTLADLHEMGLVHGSVALDHVLVDDDGRPVLCSLGCGGLAGERPAAGAAEASVLDPAADVFGLGVVLAALLARANGRSRTAAGDALRRLAESAMAAGAADRPPARQLADAVHDAVPGARLPSPEAPGASSSGSVAVTTPAAAAGGGVAAGRAQPPAGLEAWRRAQVAVGARARGSRRRLRGLAGALGGVAAAGAGLVLVSTGSSSTAAPPATTDVLPETTAPVVATTTSSPAPVTTTTATTAAVAVTVPVHGRADCPVVGGPLTADVDGDGCAESIRYAGGVVEAAGARWAVGEPDDVVAVGDWACTGTRSLAVLRPRTGEVFTFTGWATAGHDAQAPLLARVPGGQAVRAADLDADGCNEVVVERSGAAPAVLRAPRARP